MTQLQRGDGTSFAVWCTTTSSGDLCTAQTSLASPRDRTTSLESADLEYGCQQSIVEHDGSSKIVELTRPDQISNLFTEDGDTILYGVAPFAGTETVWVTGPGVDRELDVRTDTLGYGAALPEAGGAGSLDLIFLDAAGDRLGIRTVEHVG